MRDLIIKYFFLNYQFKALGKLWQVKRAATPTVFAFFIGVLYQTIFSDAWWAIVLGWMPFVICIYLGFFYHRTRPVKYEEISDWNQQWQYLHKPDTGRVDETFPVGDYYHSEVKRLAKIHAVYFNGDNVDVFKRLAPLIITVVGCVVYIALMVNR